MTTAKKLIITVGIIGVAGTIGYFVYTGIKKKTEEDDSEAKPEAKDTLNPEAKKIKGPIEKSKLTPEIISTQVQNTTQRGGFDKGPVGATEAPHDNPIAGTRVTPIQNVTIRPVSTVLPSGKLPFPIKTAFGRGIDGLQFSAEGSSWNNN